MSRQDACVELCGIALINFTFWHKKTYINFTFYRFLAGINCTFYPFFSVSREISSSARAEENMQLIQRFFPFRYSSSIQ